jgi:hypothetical protein
MLALIRDKGLRDELSAKALRFAQGQSWKVKRHIYLDLVDGLCRRGNKA